MIILTTNIGPKDSLTSLLVIWFSMGSTTLIPSKAKLAVPKKIGKFAALNKKQFHNCVVAVYHESFLSVIMGIGQVIPNSIGGRGRSVSRPCYAKFSGKCPCSHNNNTAPNKISLILPSVKKSTLFRHQLYFYAP